MGPSRNISPIFFWLKQSFTSQVLSPSSCQDPVATSLGCLPAHYKVPRSTLRLPVVNSVADDAALEAVSVMVFSEGFSEGSIGQWR